MIISLLSSILFLVGFQVGETNQGLENRAYQLVENLNDETEVSIGRKNLHSETPFSIENIPVDRKHSFDRNYANASLDGETAEIYNNRTIFTYRKTNKTRSLSLFSSNISHDFYQDIQTGSWMNNSHVSVLPGGSGLKSLKVDGKEVLNPSADFKIGSFTVSERTLHAELEEKNFKIYNGSSELIFENASDVSFELKNLSTLYWGADNSTTELSTTGDLKNGNTPGFTVASSYGVTFTGDLEANVSKPDPSTVLAKINAERLRVNLHNKGYKAGWRRIKAYEKGRTVFGPQKTIKPSSIESFRNLRDMSNAELEEILEQDTDNFNISVKSNSSGEKIFSGGSPVPLRDAVVSMNVITGLRSNGTLDQLNSRVTVW